MMFLPMLLALAAQTTPSGDPKPVPNGNPGTWVTPEDYPPASLRDGIEGAVGFRLDVDGSGAVTGCTVTVSSGSADLDAATCPSVRARAAFFPATDRRKRKVASTWASRVQWRLPPPAPLGSWVQVNRFVLAGNGRIRSCVTQTRGTAPPGHGFCESTRNRMLPAPLSPLARLATDARPLSVTLELGFNVEGLAPLTPEYVAPGRTVHGVSELAFEVSEAGAIENCTLPDVRGEVGLPPELCRMVTRRYETSALGAPRRRSGNAWVAVSSEPPKPRR